MTFDFRRLLDPRPMALEMGHERLDSGILHVAVRTDLHRCKGEMLEWWFGSRPMTREYRWWHPIDHISSDWIEGAKGNVVGSIHVVEECITDLPAVKLQIQFRDPAEVFGAAELAAARSSGSLSGTVCGFASPGDDPKRKPSGEMFGSRVVHVARDTDWGTVLRSHFLLGIDLPALGAPPAVLLDLFPDVMAPALLQHCYDEFTMLSRMLPSLYQAEGIDPWMVKRPW